VLIILATSALVSILTADRSHGGQQNLGERDVASPAIVVLALAENSILSIDGSFLFVLVSIICLIYILNRTLFRPINKILEERERRGVGRIAEARQMLSEYESRVQRYEEQVRAVRAEAYSRFETQRRELLAARQQFLAQARTETAGQVGAARAEIGAQTADARGRLDEDAQAMAASISAQILHRPVATEGNLN
jgi:F-type H+-transporting ATPase subunit b